MKKTCISCGNKLSGRIDKKFCNNSCKNDYHNNTQVSGGPVVKMVSAAIRRNRKILQQLVENGLMQLQKNELECYGFNFKGLTGIEESDGGNHLYFCYEFSILKKGKFFEVRKSH